MLFRTDPLRPPAIQQNDILKLLNDQILTEPDQLAKLVRSFSDGTNVTLTILRKGQEQKVTVKLAKKDVPSARNFRSRPASRILIFNFDMGDFGMTDLQEEMRRMKDQVGEQQRELIRDAVVKARDAANRAREQALRIRDEALRPPVGSKSPG